MLRFLFGFGPLYPWAQEQPEPSEPVVEVQIPAPADSIAPVEVQLTESVGPILLRFPEPDEVGWALTQPWATVLASAGVLGAATLAFIATGLGRRQTEKHFTLSNRQDRFTTIASQLADPSAAVRIAGVYAMEALADDWLAHPLNTSRKEKDAGRHEAQTCINVLCSYLREPYEPSKKKGTPTKTIIREELSNRVIEEHHEHRPNDGQVRQSILRVIASHLRPTAQTSWCQLDLDFTGAYLEDSDFAECRFHGRTVFTEVQFHGEKTSFSKTQFHSKTTTFDKAQFHSKTTWFVEAQFLGESSSFSKTQFHSKTTWFVEAQFHSRHTTFDNAQFLGESSSFSEAQFHGATTWFDKAQFLCESSSFSKTQFHGATTWFDKAQFHSRHTTFSKAQFHGGNIAFNEAQFRSKNTTFSEAQFRGATTSFDKAQFHSKTTWFVETQFHSMITWFDKAQFLGESTSFSKAQFHDGRTSFSKAQFRGESTSFSKAQFGGKVDFSNLGISC